MPIFTLQVSEEQAQALLSALQNEVESCIRADLRDRENFGFGPVIREDSMRDRAYLSARQQAAIGALEVMKDSGVPYAAESLERARGAQERIWAQAKREQEEKALLAKIDKSEALRETLRLCSIDLATVVVRKNAKAHASFTAFDAEVSSTLKKANEKVPGWASKVPDLASHAQNLARSLTESSAKKLVYNIGFHLDQAFSLARQAAREVS